MKCDEIQLLLADYHEGNLPAGDAARVKEHLRTCADCREELQFLKKYMKKIESFPALKAPDDFLDKVHQRIDTPERGSLVARLFFPLKIKVPLEIAALLALAVTGLLLFKPFRPDVVDYKAEEPGRQIARGDDQSPHKDSGLSRRERPAAAAERLKAREKEYGPAADKKVAASRVEDMVTSNITESEQLSKEELKSSRGEQAEITLYLKQNALPGAEPAMDDSFQARNQDRAEETRAASRKSPAIAKKDKSASEGALQYDRGQASIEDLAGLAQSLEGRIIKKTRDGKEGYNTQVIVEIPRKNYSQFMKGLRSNWSVQRQYPAEPSGRASKVQLNINLHN